MEAQSSFNNDLNETNYTLEGINSRELALNNRVVVNSFINMANIPFIINHYISFPWIVNHLSLNKENLILAPLFYLANESYNPRYIRELILELNQSEFQLFYSKIFHSIKPIMLKVNKSRKYLKIICEKLNSNELQFLLNTQIFNNKQDLISICIQKNSGRVLLNLLKLVLSTANPDYSSLCISHIISIIPQIVDNDEGVRLIEFLFIRSFKQFIKFITSHIMLCINNADLRRLAFSLITLSKNEDKVIKEYVVYEIYPNINFLINDKNGCHVIILLFTEWGALTCSTMLKYIKDNIYDIIKNKHAVKIVYYLINNEKEYSSQLFSSILNQKEELINIVQSKMSIEYIHILLGFYSIDIKSKLLINLNELKLSCGLRNNNKIDNIISLLYSSIQ